MKKSSGKIVLDEFGNTLIPNPLLQKGVLYTDRVIRVGQHEMCCGTMTLRPISTTHTVLACNGDCRFAIHVPRSITSLTALEHSRLHRNGEHLERARVTT